MTTRTTAWSEVFEYSGHKITAQSGTSTVYLTITNQTRQHECVAMTPMQLETLHSLIGDAIKGLMKDGHWPPVPRDNAK